MKFSWPVSMFAAATVGAVLLGGNYAADAKRAAPPVDASTPKFNLTTFRLANGLEVILAPDPSVTSAVVHVWYHVGSKDEVAGKTGFAHLFEHLMFKGSAHVPDGKFDVLLEGAGGWNNGTTNNDRTNYFEQIPASQLPLALWLEADRMAGLWDAMNQEVLDNQRDVVKNERRQSYENRPYGLADLEVQQSLWPVGHGNHNLTIGTMADLTSASLADVEGFWRTYYKPSNATLVIVGGIDPQETRALVEKYFAWMPASPKPTTNLLTTPVTPKSEAAALSTTDNVQAAKVIVAYRTDAPYTTGEADLEVAAQVLGGGKTSRLYRRLVMRDRLASEAYAYVSSQMLGGELHIEAIARDGVDPAALRKAIEEEVALLRTTPVTTDELARAKAVMRADFIKGLQDLSSRAEALATWAAYTGSPDYAERSMKLVADVSPSTLQSSSATWLSPTAAVTMTVLPKPETAASTGGAK